MALTNHLYLILFPNHALVASQLDPDAFAQHYQVGSTRHYHGKLIFAELDPEFRHDFFRIDWAFEGLKAHPDGRPKATKFVSSYRVLEHVSFEAIQRLYLATIEGFTLALEPASPKPAELVSGIRLYTEICPLNMLVLSRHDPLSFGEYIADPENPKGVPKLFFAELDLNIEEFLARFEQNPFIHVPFPGLHPSKLRDALLEFKADPEKTTKGVSLFSSLMEMSFKILDKGFWIANHEQSLYFPMPSTAEIEKNHYQFFRSM